jgi:hypothetical protein
VADSLQGRLDEALTQKDTAEYALRDLQARMDNAQPSTLGV